MKNKIYGIAGVEVASSAFPLQINNASFCVMELPQWNCYNIHVDAIRRTGFRVLQSAQPLPPQVHYCSDKWFRR